MKKLSMVLPLALLLAYCSGPNNTQQTNTETNTDATASTTTTTSQADMATASTDVSDVNTNTTTVTTDDMNHADRTVGTVTVDHSTSVINPIPNDPNDPMYQFWQRTNGQYWTYDYNYPGYNRPTAYNTAINGDWQLIMTPELVTAWRTDDSRTLWLREGNTYVSASETFNTRTDINAMSTGTMNANATTNTNINGAATLNGQYSSTFDPQSENNIASKSNAGTVTVNGSNSAGTISSNNSSASTAGLNNNASANANTANRMNGSTGTTVTTTSPVTSPANPGVTISANSNSTSTTNGLGTAQVNGTATGTLSTHSSGTMNATTTMDPAMNSTTAVQGTMDVNSINYQAYNGNMYQMPKFNLYLDNGSFTGYTGCNGISGRVEVTGNSLRFMNTTPSTAIDCMGGFDEKALVEMLKRVDAYTYVGDELQLMQGNQVLLRFKKNSQDATMK